MGVPFKQNDLILFQGDSVTDCGRNREDPNGLGSGYPMLTSAWLAASYSEQQLRLVNRGISGNRTCDLLTRWEQDCIALQPAWVSILIGINNTWRRYDSNDPTPVERFEQEYRRLLEWTKRETSAKIVLCEPFVLPYPEDRITWREDLDPKLAVVRKLADEFADVLVPLDVIFEQAATRQAPQYWAADGVHPTLAGHALIAQSWVKHVCG
ncbi:MAG: SGNH/GDSL hydrolase family protein [Chloroflexi bacterium]|jgi:acyl-CoA thioesterase-1|nr:SGNH/GDSL hydrolase family protein [Chloroflexota bacterium]